MSFIYTHNTINVEDEQFQLLFKRWCERKTTDQEDIELARYFAEKDTQATLSPLLREQWNQLNANKQSDQDDASIKMANTILQQSIDDQSPLSETPITYMRRQWLKYAAAILLLAASATTIYFIQRTNTSEGELPQLAEVPVDILPGGAKATLTLADGRIIILDSTSDGSVAQQGYTKIIKPQNGQLSYMQEKDKQQPVPATPNSKAAIMYNTISTPNGGQYQITLPDGSRVWLNAASSLTFPTTFQGTARKVMLKGEAYFEIDGNKNAPFIVEASDNNIMVLGTSFNVHAYAEPGTVKTSLCDGVVKVNNTILKPGQAFVRGRVIATNIEQDIAWKDGVFDFRDLKVEDAMRQLARWYNLEIVYEGSVANKVFGGRMGRGLTLSQVLRGLDGVGVYLKLEGKVLYVRPS